MQKTNVPQHVIRPSSATYRSTTDFPEMNRSSRGYAMLRALGAHEGLSDEEIEIVIAWTNEFHQKNNRITPHTDKLMIGENEDIPLMERFKKRLGPDFNADIAAPNVAAYQGDKKTPSYKSIFESVWVEQRWPSLCKALAEK